MEQIRLIEFRNQLALGELREITKGAQRFGLQVGPLLGFHGGFSRTVSSKNVCNGNILKNPSVTDCENIGLIVTNQEVRCLVKFSLLL